MNADNHSLLDSLDWQVHVYGTAPEPLVTACNALRLPVHALPYDAECESVGLKRNAMYLVRPDGYVALAATESVVEQLGAYVNRIGLRMP